MLNSFQQKYNRLLSMYGGLPVGEKKEWFLCQNFKDFFYSCNIVNTESWNGILLTLSALAILPKSGNTDFLLLIRSKW